MIDEILEQVVQKALEYCGKEENQEKIIRPVEQFVSIRFAWILRCFELIASLAILHTLMLAYMLFKLHTLVH